MHPLNFSRWTAKAVYGLSVPQRDCVGTASTARALRVSPVEYRSHRLPFDRVNHPRCQSHKLISAILARQRRPPVLFVLWHVLPSGILLFF